MAEETSQQQEETTTPTDAEEITEKDQFSSSIQKEINTRKTKFIPPEELFDLTKPIPKVCRPYFSFPYSMFRLKSLYVQF